MPDQKDPQSDQGPNLYRRGPVSYLGSDSLNRRRAHVAMQRVFAESVRMQGAAQTVAEG